MVVEENKDIVRLWVQARNTNDLETTLSLFAEEWREALTAGFNGMTNAFPDVHVSIEDIIGEGNQVVTSWTLTGTHCGDYQGIPATQKQISLPGIDIYTVESGKIVSVIRQSDNLSLLKQLGVTLSWQGEVIT